MKTSDICQAMQKFSLKFNEIAVSTLELEHYTDGMPFAHMLISSNTLNLSLNQLELNTDKWIIKVSNLKKILMKITALFQSKNIKIDRITKIDVVQIAKNNSVQHLSMFFQLIVSILISSVYKQKYIQQMMSLDPASQTVFVNIIRNTQNLTLCLTGQDQIDQTQLETKNIRVENVELKDELCLVKQKSSYLQNEVSRLKDKLAISQQRCLENSNLDQMVSKNQFQLQLLQQRILIDNLKTTLLQTARNNQIQLSQLRQQVVILRKKAKQAQDLEASVETYKQMHKQYSQIVKKNNELLKQKCRLLRIIDQKDVIIRNLRPKIETSIFQKQSDKVEIDIQQELKKQVLFRDAQRQMHTFRHQLCKSMSRIQYNCRQEQEDQINYLREQLTTSNASKRELQIENIKNRKKIEKITQLEAEKKKLEKIVLEVNRTKDSEIEMLVVAFYELRNQNNEMISRLRNQRNQIKQDGK